MLFDLFCGTGGLFLGIYCLEIKEAKKTFMEHDKKPSLFDLLRFRVTFDDKDPNWYRLTVMAILVATLLVVLWMAKEFQIPFVRSLFQIGSSP